MPERHLSRLAALLAAFLAAGCAASAQRRPLEEPSGPINRVAILRLERAEPVSETELASRPTDNPEPRLAPNAETVVTAQIYGVLANDPRWRLVPDLDVDGAMRQVPLAGTIEARAQALGELTDAQGVLTGRVFRFQNRVGSELGARHGASVAIELIMVETATGKTLWRGQFDQTQRDLSSNLFTFWMFWEGGGRWMSAAELARIGIERLVGDMDAALQQ
jgi:hypothetical protein